MHKICTEIHTHTHIYVCQRMPCSRGAVFFHRTKGKGRNDRNDKCLIGTQVLITLDGFCCCCRGCRCCCYFETSINVQQNRNDIPASELTTRSSFKKSIKAIAGRSPPPPVSTARSSCRRATSFASSWRIVSSIQFRCRLKAGLTSNSLSNGPPNGRLSSSYVA